MSLTLAVADQQNSTALATVAGSGGGAVSVYTSPLSQSPPDSWTLAGTRTGDGTLTLSGAGLFWAYALAGGVPSVPVAYGCTSNPLPVHQRCLLAVQGVIQSAGLANFDPSRVYTRLNLENPNVTFPCVMLTFSGLKEARGEEDSIGMIQDGMLAPTYPVHVHLADRHSPNDVTKVPQYLQWRQQLMAFGVLDGVQLANVPEVWVTKVRPQDVGSQVGEKLDYFVSSFLVECHAYTAGVG